MTRCLAAVALAASLVATARPAGQQSFRSAAEAVAVYATVMDKAGHLVLDLTKDDFEIRDAGRPRPITIFSNDLQPITIVIMLDRSGSMMSRADVVEHAAETFVRQLLPADRVRIGDFSEDIRIRPVEYISDRDALIRILRTQLQDDLNGPSPVWASLLHAIAALRSEHGRKVVLIFSDGHDEPEPYQFRAKFGDVLKQAVQDEVIVYSIAVPATVPAAFGYFNGRSFGGGTRTEPPDKHLRELSEATGGGYVAFDWAQNLNETFSRVAEELHHQYLIGFAPDRLDGRTHAIQLNVLRPNLTVRARKSYVAR
jgi:Ca-activated chloride channel family protein